MFKSLFSRMIGAYLSAAVAIIILLGFFSGTIFRKNYIDSAKKMLSREADEVMLIVEEEYLDSAKREIGREKLIAVARQFDALVQIDFNDPTIGRCCFFDYRTGERWIVCAELGIDELLDAGEAELFDGEEYFTDLLSDYTGIRTLSIKKPLVDHGDIYGTLLLNCDMSDVYSSLSELYFDIFLAALGAVLITVAITYIITKRITKPVSHMTEVVNALSHGNYDARVKVQQDDELGSLGRSFNYMADRVAGLDQARREFVANVSHELRSPLTSMRGFLEAMEEGVIPPEEHGKYFEVVLDENRRMADIVNDLLDIARIESGQYSLNRSVFDVGELITRSILTFESRIENAGIKLDIDLPSSPLYVNADKNRIDQVLHNLVDNAIKFSDESGGRIGVCAVPDRQKVMISISNNGPDIPPEDISRLFDRFYKAEKAHTYTGTSGTGLGLSIVKLILDQHDEDISVSSKDGTTKFTFTLKRANAHNKRNMHS